MTHGPLQLLIPVCGRQVPISPPIILAAGLALGTSAALGWLDVGLLILLGVLVAMGVSLPTSIMASLSALIGLVHGLANGGAFADSDSGFFAVAGIAAAVVVLAWFCCVSRGPRISVS